MSGSLSPVRILIVDDHPLLRDGVKTRVSLEPGWEVCGEAATSDEALSCARETHPHVVLLDLCLPDGHGLDLLKRLHGTFPDLKLLVLSGCDELEYGERAVRAGAAGFLHKQAAHEHLVTAIRTVLAGEPYVSPALSRQLVARAIRGETDPAPTARLSDRELEVFRLIGNGLSSSLIAHRLHLSPHTIDTHRDNIKRKLQLKSAGELSRSAMQWVLEHE